MKRPAFQFYPGDWMSNANLRRCSWAARGVWVEVLALMHDSEEYGTLRWPLRDIVTAIGCPAELVDELAAKAVLKGCDEGMSVPYVYVPRHARQAGNAVILLKSEVAPFWYSSRLVRDEYRRRLHGARTRFPKTNGSPNPQCGDECGEVCGDEWGGYWGSGSSSSSSSKNKNTPANADPNAIPRDSDPTANAVARTLAFEEFWKAYPRKIDKKAALRAWLKLKPELYPKILEALETAKRTPQWTEKNGQFIPYPTRWINGERWNDDLKLPEPQKGLVI